MAKTPFNPKDLFYVESVHKNWLTPDGDDDEDFNEQHLPSGWFKTREAADAYAVKKAQDSNNMYVVMQPIQSVLKVPPEVTTVKLV